MTPHTAPRITAPRIRSRRYSALESIARLCNIVGGLCLLSLNEHWSIARGDALVLAGAFAWAAHVLVISRLSDMVLFVVRPRLCRRAAIKMASQTCRKMELVRGMVINGVLTRRGGYYHYYRGSYYGSKTTDTQES